MSNDYVQYGCGWSAPKNWRNFDVSPTVRFERIPVLGGLYTKNDLRFPKNVEFGDIVKGLPIPDNSCKGVYCSHVLEHLSLDDSRRAIENTLCVLMPGGSFRFVLPDLEYSAIKYLNSRSPDAAHVFLKETLLGRERRERSLMAFVRDWVGNSRHLWMWDYKSMVQQLENAGFVQVRRASYGDFTDVMFEDVEDEARWENCLGIECKKG